VARRFPARPGRRYQPEESETDSEALRRDLSLRDGVLSSLLTVVDTRAWDRPLWAADRQ
jgi:hypothetical protein